MKDWTTRDVRERALRILAERGWEAGAGGEDGPVGADWAIAIASGEAYSGGAPAPDGPYLTTMTEIEYVLERGSLMDWEMKEGRTVDEVMDLLRQL